MNINYNLEMEKEIEKIKSEGRTPTLLLHSCCGPCSTCVIERLSDVFKIVVFYYNPNIYPEEEYFKRKEVELDFIKKYPAKIKVEFLDCDYNPDEFNNIAKGYEHCREGEERCYRCYNLRMEETAKVAKEHNYDYFTTTLSVSPHKNSKWINEIGFKLEEKYGIKFLASDFKKKDGYKRSIELSCKYCLYRQRYCGCVYSLAERLEQDKKEVLDESK